MTTNTPAYLVAGYKVNDTAGLNLYLEKVGPIVQPYGGKLIAFNLNVVAKEGKALPSFAIVEFPSLQIAEEFYNSEEYQPVKALRVNATEGFLFLTEGMPSHG